MQRILNLGCGDDKFGTHRVDKFPTSAATHVFDVEDGIKFPDNFFDEIYERNILEHLINVGFHLKECYRVLKDNGKITIITDNAACQRFYMFGTHTGRYEKKHPGDKHFSIFTMNHIMNHIAAAGFKIENIKYVKTDTLGRIIDFFTRQPPRIMVVAKKC